MLIAPCLFPPRLSFFPVILHPPTIHTFSLSPLTIRPTSWPPLAPPLPLPLLGPRPSPGFFATPSSVRRFASSLLPPSSPPPPLRAAPPRPPPIRIAISKGVVFSSSTKLLALFLYFFFGAFARALEFCRLRVSGREFYEGLTLQRDGFFFCYSFLFFK